MSQSAKYRSTASIKYEAQLVICKDIYQVNVWQLTTENLGKDHCHRLGPRHAEEVSGYLRHPVLGTKAVQGHALGTHNTLQNSKEARRKKSIDM